jgi:hypothetical protein
LQPIELPPGVLLTNDPPAVHADGSFFYPHGNKLVHLIRQSDGRWREEIDQLPSSLLASGVYANTRGADKSVWIIADEPTTTPNQDIVQAHLLRWDGPGKIAAIPDLSFPRGYMTDELFQSDSVITITGADYSGTAMFAPVSVFRSKDRGKSWRSERTASGAKARPVAFYGREAWAVGTENRLQHRRP